MSSAEREARALPPIIVNQAEVPETTRTIGERWGAAYKPLTPSMRPRGGSLGINMMRLAPGHTTCPFHHHRREDEAFYVLSGRGVLRYGDELHPIGPGDCIACPAGTGIAHQIANPHDEELVYLAIGGHDPDEVCVYPDSGKVLIRGLQRIGWIEAAGYMDGEPDEPRIFGMIRDREGDA